jgi:hypothetical protein
MPGASTKVACATIGSGILFIGNNVSKHILFSFSRGFQSYGFGGFRIFL